jgi:ribonuclease HII
VNRRQGEMRPATFSEEIKLWEAGLRIVAGLDEVGRGSWAGPVVAAAVIFPPLIKPPFAIFDSKLLGSREREKLAKEITKVALWTSIAKIDLATINRVGIGQATQFAFRKAIRLLPAFPEFFLIDAFYIRYLTRKKQKPIKKGDRVCASIAAASILAKVYRDRLMRETGRKFPEYGFGRHKGYGTKRHQEALEEFGVLPIHRHKYSWIQTRLAQGLLKINGQGKA